MSPTEIALLATHKNYVLRVDRVCDEYLGINYDRARRMAALNRLPFSVFTMGESQKAPLLVTTKELADYIDKTAEAARKAWAASQV